MNINNLNKKGELRLQHIIIAVLVMSLFGVMLLSFTSDFIQTHSNGTITSANLSDGGVENNQSAFLIEISKLNNMTSEISGIGKSAPGGSESATSPDALEAEGSTIKAGYNFISNIGNWLFRYPKLLIGSFLGFFGLPSEFAGVAVAIIVTIVSIILISSVLKNRL